MLAASELFSRDWRYHKDEKFWVTRTPDSNKNEVGRSCERGVFWVFDPLLWKKTIKHLTLDYSSLEERPVIPTPPQNGDTTAQGQGQR